MYLEILSPNVTHINNSHIESGIRSTVQGGFPEYTVNCHGNDIYEFVPVFPSGFVPLAISVKSAFNAYNNAGHLYDVSTSGLKDLTAGVGSKRFCTFSDQLAAFLTDIISEKSFLQTYTEKIETESTGTVKNYEFVNVSKYFRFMQYYNGGEHFPHYDSDFHYNNTRDPAVTKFSVVMYFSDCETGEFCFVNDSRRDDFGQTPTTDWEQQATNEEITLRIKPSVGKILLFPHNLCHTVLPYTDTHGSRMVARSDILFRVVN